MRFIDVFTEPSPHDGTEVSDALVEELEEAVRDRWSKFIEHVTLAEDECRWVVTAYFYDRYMPDRVVKILKPKIHGYMMGWLEARGYPAKSR